MAFDEKFIEELKQKNNIVDIVGRYCVLKKKGKSHWACCPLPGHSEKTPSFTVNESGQFFKCFGCGRGGDVITFVMTMENLDYVGAVRYLAENAGMPMPEDKRDDERRRQDKNTRDRQLSLMKDTALFYVHNLRDERAKPHNDYIAYRRIDRKTVTAFGIGASLDFHSLPQYLGKKGYTEEEMLKCGVCQKKTKEDGSSFLFDALGGRLIIPIINNLNNVIAFGGRLLEKKPQFAKYKNTQETDLFIKNRTLYNINNLKKEKATNGLTRIIMVEGYMDAISVYNAGFRNVVASMGTSLTVEQARMLKRYADTVLISYDGDGAGQKATIRGLEILKKEGLEVKVVSLPDGLDPDDVIKKFGAEAYEQLLDDSLPLVDFKIKNLKKEYNLKNLSEKRKYLSEAIKVIAECENESIKEDLLRKLGKDTDTTYESLKRDSDKVVVDDNAQTPPETVTKDLDEDGVKNAERFILCSILLGKPYAKNYNLYGRDFSDPVHGKIVEAIEESKGNGKEIFPSSVAGLFDENELVEFNAVLSSGDNVYGSDGEEKYFKDCSAIIRKDDIEKELKLLGEAYRNETDLSKRRELIGTISDLTKESNKL